MPEEIEKQLELDVILEPLADQGEKTFVLALLEGADLNSAAIKANYSRNYTSRAVSRLLAKERVKLAIKQSLPFYADIGHKMKIGSIFASDTILAAALGTKTDANSLSAARDMLDRAGHSAVSKSVKGVASFSQMLKAIDADAPERPTKAAKSAKARTIELPSKSAVWDSSGGMDAAEYVSVEMGQDPDITEE